MTPLSLGKGTASRTAIIDTSKVSSGPYIVQLKGKNSIRTEKLLKL